MFGIDKNRKDIIIDRVISNLISGFFITIFGFILYHLAK